MERPAFLLKGKREKGEREKGEREKGERLDERRSVGEVLGRKNARPEKRSAGKCSAGV